MSPFSNLCHFAILCMRALSMSGFIAIHNIFITSQSFSQPKLSRCSLFNFRWHGVEFWFEGSWIKASRLSPKNPSVSQTPYLPQPPDRFHTFQRPSSRISIAIQIEFKLLKNEIILNFTYLTEATIETQCCAKGKLSPSLQNRGSTKTDMVKLRSSCSTPTDQIPWYLPPSSLIFPFPSDWQTTSKVVLMPAWVNFFTSKETVNAFNNIISQKW